MKLLAGKTAIVTGAGRGIGQAVAELFADNGAMVVVHYNSSRAPAVELAERIGGVALGADLRDPEQVSRLMEEALAAFGSVDILINNAASFAHAGSFSEETWQTYIEEFEGVFGTTYHPTSAVIPIMKDQGGGRIVNFAATLLQRPAVGYGAHTCAKAAVLALTRNLAKELGPHNITVNAVSPGMTLTDFSKSLSEAERDRVSAVTPLRKLAEPDDVAQICLFYASELGKFVTGANTAPDGGLAIM
jgi:3-oxoacyl-[acyl-carrier protein] reductase